MFNFNTSSCISWWAIQNISVEHLSLKQVILVCEALRTEPSSNSSFHVQDITLVVSVHADFLAPHQMFYYMYFMLGLYCNPLVILSGQIYKNVC